MLSHIDKLRLDWPFIKWYRLVVSAQVGLLSGTRGLWLMTTVLRRGLSPWTAK